MEVLPRRILKFYKGYMLNQKEIKVLLKGQIFAINK
jgi:hypothetical protein